MPPTDQRGRAGRLVGRAGERAALLAALDPSPAVVLLEGEAGIGKSRLVAEVLAAGSPAALPLVGVCAQVGEPFPYGAVLESLRDTGPALARCGPLNPVTGALAPLLPEIAAHLPPPPPPTGDARADRHRVFRGVRALLAALGEVLLVIEDLQWADDGTRALVRFLLGDPPPGLRVLLSYRREHARSCPPLGTGFRPAPGMASAHIPVPPLDVDDTRALTESVLGGAAVSAAFAAKLHERTAGIPFVIEETLRALRDPHGAVHADSDAAHRLLDAAGVPLLLRDGMAERLARLPVTAARLAHAAAVLGVPAPAELLGTLAGVPDPRLGEAVSHALDGGVLCEVGAGRYGFRHALARAAAYDTLPAPDRVHLHTRAITMLSAVDPPPLVQLAEHSERAGLDEQWLHYAEAAADRAIELSDAPVATALLQRLLRAPALPAEHVDRLALKLGTVAFLGLDQRAPVELLERLLDNARLSAAARGEVRLYLGLLLLRADGGLPAARAQTERAVAEVAATRPDLAARGIAVLAQPYHGTVPLAQVRPWIDRTERIRAATTDREQWLWLTANQLGARAHLGEVAVLAELDRLPDSGATTGEQRQIARCRCNAADAAAYTGHLRVADDLLRPGLSSATDAGAAFVASTALATRARLDWLTGAWAGLAERTADQFDEYADLFPVASEFALVLGCLAAARGAWAEAAGWFDRTGAHTPRTAIAQVAVAGCAGLARVALHQADPVRAAAIAGAGVAVLRTKGIWSWSGEIATTAVAALLETGGPAADLVAEIGDGLAGRDTPLADAALAECRGRLAEHDGDVGGAVAHYREAERRYAELPAPYLAALAAERAALCLLPTDHDAATALLRERAGVLDALGATHDAARFRHHLRVTGTGALPGRGRRGYGNELSPRELDVAGLLAAGRTNREIAEVLFLSPRTVEQHVARVLRKLGLRSRWEVSEVDLAGGGPAHR
ncbi:hypothetical protein BJP25_17045 [Actinokineospora bangkokensis]|uniref:HTH luxR-type domain-containing protein n=1 Tax=Actinokineospora bangkokensis TaxID=1193682 RepID=A0A1Q9LMV6_9PSEU|nr:hypothetical protein BJP25_17045 [Actinokineospora bangkokensis]